MIIAIASNDGINVAAHPAQCSGFVVFEIGPASAVRVGYRSNDGPHDSEVSAVGGRVAPDPEDPYPYRSMVAALSDCGALVSGKMDDPLRRELLRSGIDVFVSGERNVDQAAQCLAESHGLRI